MTGGEALSEALRRSHRGTAAPLAVIVAAMARRELAAESGVPGAVAALYMKPRQESA